MPYDRPGHVDSTVLASPPIERPRNADACPTPQNALYFLGLQITNARCFTDTQTLSLAASDAPDAGPASWTLLVGDNGVGKSTLLQCLAWMRPIPYYPRGPQRPHGIQPWLHDQDPPTLVTLLRDGARRTELRATMVEAPDLRSPRSSTVNTAIELLSEDSGLKDVRLIEGANTSATTGDPFIITYAANRHMGRQNADASSESEPVDLLKTDSTELADAADVLSRLDYSALKDNPRSRACLDSMRRALTEILPFVGDAADIDILDPAQPAAGLRFRTPYGNVPLQGLSLGHRTATAWIIDLAWKLVQKYDRSDTPLAEPAVVLIDEIDLHLHPRWQRTIMKQFSDHFPNVQFVATTHSPLMITSMADVNVAVLRQTDGDHVVIENDPQVVESWRFDQTLVNLFELDTARSARIEALMKERETLLQEIPLTARAEERLQHIADEMSALPTAERPEDQRAMEIIRQAAADIQAARGDRT